MSDDTELLPCPFCGWINPSWRVERHAYDWIEYSVHCGNCEAESAMVDSKEAAAVVWNRRVSATVPIDDIVSVIARYTFLIERGRDGALDRLVDWLDVVRPLE